MNKLNLLSSAMLAGVLCVSAGAGTAKADTVSTTTQSTTTNTTNVPNDPHSGATSNMTPSQISPRGNASTGTYPGGTPAVMGTSPVTTTTTTTNMTTMDVVSSNDSASLTSYQPAIDVARGTTDPVFRALVPSTVDYGQISKAPYTYADLISARSKGFYSDQMAEMAAISDYSGVPFKQILNEASAGTPIWQVADDHNVPSSKVNDDSYRNQLDSYVAAYETTGSNRRKAIDGDQPHMVIARTIEGYDYPDAAFVQGPGVPASRNGMQFHVSGNAYEYNFAATTKPAGPWVWDTTGDQTVAAASVPATAPDQSNSLRTIIGTARQAGNFTMFLKAVNAAGLTGLLREPGPFTVFAPTDDAFMKIPSDQLTALLGDQTKLTQVLEFHIIPQRITAADAMGMTSPTSPATLQGQSLNVVTSNGNVTVNGAKVVTPDIQASNGVIHAIDTVLMPAM